MERCSSTILSTDKQNNDREKNPGSWISHKFLRRIQCLLTNNQTDNSKKMILPFSILILLRPITVLHQDWDRTKQATHSDNREQVASLLFSPPPLLIQHTIILIIIIHTTSSFLLTTLYILSTVFHFSIPYLFTPLHIYLYYTYVNIYVVLMLSYFYCEPYTKRPPPSFNLPFSWLLWLWGKHSYTHSIFFTLEYIPPSGCLEKGKVLHIFKMLELRAKLL